MIKSEDDTRFIYIDPQSREIVLTIEKKFKPGKPDKRTKSSSDLKLEDSLTERYKVDGMSEPEARLKAQKVMAENKTSGSKNPSKEKALKRISDIEKAKATLGDTDIVTQLMTLLNPELAGKEGQEIDANTKESLMEAWDNEIDYLEQFSGTKRKKRKKKPEPGEYTFTIEGGMQPTKK